ncbi:hypothetical protein FRC03_001607 [Tulasnella sp. 419]|nr:hypothetical protein FRC03_001607 [Tulasnella sp. 419]
MANTVIAGAPSLTLLHPYLAQKEQKIDALDRVSHDLLRFQTTGIPTSPLSCPPTLTLTHSEHQFFEKVAELSSQHHLSEYNKLKHGGQGSPFLYIPLSVRDPQEYKELQGKQKADLLGRAFFPAQRHEEDPGSWRTGSGLRTPPSGTGNGSDSHLPPFNSQTETKDSVHAFSEQCCVLNPSLNHTLLEEAILHAMSSPLLPPRIEDTHPQSSTSVYRNEQSSFLYPNIQVKTSVSHPINISTLIPPEFLALVTAHFRQNYPVLFSRSSCSSLQHLPAILDMPIELRFPHFLKESRGSHPGIQATFHRQERQSWCERRDGVAEQNLLAPEFPASTAEGSIGYTITAANSSPSDIANIMAFPRVAPDMRMRIFSSSADKGSSKPPGGRTRLISDRDSSRISTSSLFEGDIKPCTKLVTLGTDLDAPVINPRMTSDQLRIGNLFLSSCPGKKVRLSGPVKGRGTISRSLSMDLSRIRSLGVGLIINCLNDEELHFLGASWPEYADAAASIGIDVLRIPLMEGLAPTDVGQLDAQLDWVIKTYTLNGVNVHVHCRGGVGRAGLIAASWLIKMGFCGSFVEPSRSDPTYHTNEGPINGYMGLVMPYEPLALAERAVLTLRQRRSIKAIETYEQAQFLIDFAVHLHDKMKWNYHKHNNMADSLIDNRQCNECSMVT